MIRSRSFMLILYPDDDSHIKCLDSIINSEYKYAYILHDKDINEDGTLKKPHYHVVLYFDNARTISSVAKEFFISENYIDVSYKSYKYALLYLVHFSSDRSGNIPDNQLINTINSMKHRYDLNEVYGPLQKTLLKLIKQTITEEDSVLAIVSAVERQEKHITYSSFAKMICSLGLWSVYRRSALVFHEILKEHNSKY